MLITKRRNTGRINEKTTKLFSTRDGVGEKTTEKIHRPLTLILCIVWISKSMLSFYILKN